jgi:hypothetical protein
VTATAEKAHFTKAEFRAEAIARFGSDPLPRVAFECPNCGDVATLQDFLDLLKEDEAARVLGQNCIGRYLGALDDDEADETGRSSTRRGCSWVAYGLIRGPWLIDIGHGHEVPCFRLAGAKL